ncbi:uncharacterized protein LOC114517755 [Dendronephthya gigantea]|uniref:uncharacterized protein LOC114517755 n=1 Tax=Dendronephthya gigantea TaxID=151771 RepID=UPI00106C86FE|nr:uncharacterized protein LOC114517755 [Dendronephthya gigantea]
MASLYSLTYPLTVLIVLYDSLYGQSSAPGGSCGETLSTRMDRHVFHKHRFSSRVFESRAINTPLECYVNCMKSCRCLSYNICNGGKLCELNFETKASNASLYKQHEECDYYEYEFSKQSPSGECFDPCCTTSSTCLNGGRCQASCMKNNKRFNCDCPDGYGGDNCDIVHTSCASYIQSSDKTPGPRTIHGPNNQIFSVFCHFATEYAMTLVMSYSRINYSIYKTQGLGNDFPRNEDALNWGDYRLSLPRMKGIRDDGSTHWIFTCTYPERGVSDVDYLRSKFSETDIITFKPSGKTCKKKVEYVNIRGKSCEDCSVPFAQTDTKTFSVSGSDIDCGGLTGLNQPRCSPSLYVKYFGFYNCRTDTHKCSEKDDSTTQLWFAHYIG